MHEVDDVHRFVVHAGDFLEHQFEIGHHLIVVQHHVLDGRNALDHLLAGEFATPFVQCQQQSLGNVGAGTEELNLFANFLVRHATGNPVVVAATDRTHQVVIFVLDT